MSRCVSSRRPRRPQGKIGSAPPKRQNDVICSTLPRDNAGPCMLVYRQLDGMKKLYDGLADGERGEWPKQTNIYCCNCRLPFKTIPIPIVYMYDPIKNIYHVYHVACNPKCGKSFIKAENTNNTRIRLMHFRHMLITQFGWPVDEDIPDADPWESIDVFGGFQTVEQYRKTKHNVRMTLKKPPFVPYVILTETRHKTSYTIDQQKKPDENDDMPSNTLEDQAVQHGAAFVLRGLKRPKKILKTYADVEKAHPGHVVDASSEPSIFQEFLDEGNLPTEEEIQAKKDERERKRKATRKPKSSSTTSKKRKVDTST